MASLGSKSSKRSRQSSLGQEVDLHVTNPELFKASPRPGGFLKIRVPPRGEDYDYKLYENSEYDEAEDCRCSSDPNICISLSNASTANDSIMMRSKRGENVKLPNLTKTAPGREFRLKRAVESTDWTIRGIDETDTMIEISNPIQDTLNMLAVTISTIMMMAAQVPDIEDVYLDWAMKYLNCIVDEDDEEFNRPPNVQGILNHILFLKTGGKAGGSDHQKSSPRGSPPSSLKKGMDNHGGSAGKVAGGSAGGGSGGSGGKGVAPVAGGGGRSTGSGSISNGPSGKGVSIAEPRSSARSPTTLTAIKSK